MKKFFAIVLVLALVFTLCACGKADTSSDSSDTQSTWAPAFEKPKNYAAVLLVTINPKFNLYLDEAGVVLAVEPVNRDAETFRKEIDFKGQKVETVVGNLVEKANEKGFVKSDAVVHLQIVEKKMDSLPVEDVLQKTVTAVQTLADELSLDISVESADETDRADASDSVVSDDVSSSETTQKEEESKPQTSNPNPTSTHKHNYAAATCTEPKKCSCGQSEGAALGHAFKKGTCSRCGAKDPNYVESYTALAQKNGKWKTMFLQGDKLYVVSLTLCGTNSDYGVSLAIGDSFSKLPPDFQEDVRGMTDGSYVVFNGNEYYCGRGDGDGLASVQQNGNAVIVTDLSGATLNLNRTAENTLTVQSSAPIFSVLDKVPTGTVFTFSAN